VDDDANVLMVEVDGLLVDLELHFVLLTVAHSKLVLVINARLNIKKLRRSEPLENRL